MTGAVDAVAFDLFGTLVAAPTPHDRAQAATRLGSATGCDPDVAERYLLSTWRVRHDGTLPTVHDLAAHLVRAVRGEDEAIGPVTGQLNDLGQARLRPARPVVDMLRSLRGEGLRLGVLSDASAEIANAWSNSPLAALADAAVFSCQAGALKPNPRLYGLLLDALNVPARRTLYVGDGGGDELQGALSAGMAAVRVRRRGPADALAFGETQWPGPLLDAVEQVPAYLAERR